MAVSTTNAMILFLLIQLFIAVGCRVVASETEVELSSSSSSSGGAAAAGQNANYTHCKRLIPGLDRMARGIDITKLDLFTDDALHSGFGKAVLNYSCNSGKKWSQPFNPRIEYDQPDQIPVANPLPKTEQKVKASFSQNLTDYKHNILVKVGLETDLVNEDDGKSEKVGAFSAGLGFQNIQHDLTIANKSVGEASYTVLSAVMGFRAPDALLLSDDFEADLRELASSKCSDKPSLYAELLSRYGTHYFDTANFGGYLQMKSTIENSFVEHSTETKVSANLAFSLIGLFNVSLSTEFDKKNVDQTFSSRSEGVFSYYGGIGYAMQSNAKASDVHAWTDSVYLNPWLLDGKLKPLDDLVLDATLKAQVKLALEMYRLDGYLNEIKRALQLTDFPLTISETAILEKATKLVNSCDNTDIENVRKALKHVLSVPKPLTRALADVLWNQVDHLKQATLDCLVFFSYQCLVPMNSETRDQVGRWFNIQLIYGNSFVINTPKGVRDVIQNGRQFLETELTFVPELCGDKRECKECVVKKYPILRFPSEKISDMKDRYQEELQKHN